MVGYNKYSKDGAISSLYNFLVIPLKLIFCQSCSAEHISVLNNKYLDLLLHSLYVLSCLMYYGGFGSFLL